MPETVAEYDLVIIGGGINGAGIARDASRRGLSVILLEKNDFGSGTTSFTSRLIHGGLRYLEYAELPLVYESLHERGYLRKIASHLVKPIRISIPIYKSGRRGPLLIRLGMIAYDLLSIRKTLPWHRMLNRDEMLREEPGLNPEGLRGAAQYYDAQVTFAERLVLENIIAAEEAGAVVKNYCAVDVIGLHDGKAMNVAYVDQISGEKIRAKGKLVINAAGPWVDKVLQTSSTKTRRLMGGTKGSHIVVGKTRTRGAVPTKTTNGPKMPTARAQAIIPPARRPFRANGRVTRRNACQGEQPNDRATCSRRWSTESNDAFIARMQYEIDTRNWQSTIPLGSNTKRIPLPSSHRPGPV